MELITYEEYTKKVEKCSKKMVNDTWAILRKNAIN
jgi:hypothetical protein